MSMTLEEQRIAIAEWSGKEYHKPTPEEIATGSYYQYEPDYPNDLNAMEAAEAALVGHEMIRYQAFLHEICPKNPHVASWHLIHASAAQRCEALCRTLWPEKWK